jgi:GNAT superfamily N-acetyltransferase
MQNKPNLAGAGAADVVSGVGRAGAGDTGELLASQKLAFEEQCRLYDDWLIPPMLEQPEDVAGFVASGGVVLKAVAGGRIIGAVRGKLDTGICHVGRLWVHPDWQGRGAGRRLVAALEEELRQCRAYSIFTGERSEKNLALYTRQGYAPTGRRAQAKAPGAPGNYDLVWLEKPNPWPDILECAGRYASR